MNLPPGSATNLGDLLHRGGGAHTVLVDERQPDSPVVFSADGFDEQIRAFARGLWGRGIGRGQRIGFLAENRWEALVGYLATMYAGAVAVPINYKLPPSTIDHIVNDAGIDLMFYDRDRAALVSPTIDSVSFDETGSGIGSFEAFCDPGPAEAYQPAPEDLAEILYTSGSTGLPKGVPLTHEGQLWALEKYLQPIEPEGGATGSSVIVAPLFHMNAIMFSCMCLVNRVTIVLQPRFDAATYIAAVARHRCTLLTGVPTMFAMVAALGRAQIPDDLSSVTTLMIGSAPLSDALIEQVSDLFPQGSMSNGYGTTEAGPAIFGPHPEDKPRPALSIGYPFEDVGWRLVDGPTPNEGALELRTRALTSGYLNRPEANQERFVDGWYRTGDVMRRDDDGFFYFVSRVDDMFVCGGENIYPTQVEELLNSHPQVQQSLVVGAPDDLKGHVPVAFVVARPASEPSEEALKAFVIERAPAYLHPRRVVFRSSLPLGGTQKIDRRILEAEAAELMIEAGRATGS
ncbi:MAG: acyl--CoA ligase [Actinomycetia bacterium]|nr:acyl--CoA ligase [Actinomycetes bacterium]